MCVCVCVCVHACVHVCVYVCVHACIVSMDKILRITNTLNIIIPQVNHRAMGSDALTSISP